MIGSMTIPGGSTESDHHAYDHSNVGFEVTGNAEGLLTLQGTKNEQAGPWMNIINFPHPSIATHIASGSAVRMSNCPYTTIRVISDKTESLPITINIVE